MRRHRPTWGTLAYRSWRSMLGRCENPKTNGFHHYGARGISVCDQWRVFSNFLADMGERPPGTTLDRIDSSGNYEPGNCRWATYKDQVRNRKITLRIVAFGEEMPLAAWSERTGIPYHIIYKRISRGWSAESAVAKPFKRKIRTPKDEIESRNSAIIKDYADGMTYVQIGEVHGISPANARYVVRKHMDAARDNT